MEAGYHGTAIHWRGYLCISKHAELDTAVSNLEIEFTAGMYNEKTILIEALEKFLDTWNSEFGYLDRQASKKRWPNA